MVTFKNMFGSAGSNLDQQRKDLFRVSIALPSALGDQNSGTNIWDNEIAWAIAKFPFPSRAVETTQTKYLQQTNHQIGADVASESITMPVRYAFNRRSIELLERWRNLISDPRTGRVARTSVVKTTGFFYWLIPNDAVLTQESPSIDDSFKLLRAYHLEGCLLTDLMPEEADMESSGSILYSFKMQIDRYYPVNPEDLYATPGNLVALGQLNG